MKKWEDKSSEEKNFKSDMHTVRDTIYEFFYPIIWLWRKLWQ